MTYTRYLLGTSSHNVSTRVVWGSAANSTCAKVSNTNYTLQVNDNTSFTLVYIEGIATSSASSATSFVTVTCSGSAEHTDENSLTNNPNVAGTTYIRTDGNTYFGKFSQFDIVRSSSSNPVLVHVFQLIL